MKQGKLNFWLTSGFRYELDTELLNTVKLEAILGILRSALLGSGEL